MVWLWTAVYVPAADVTFNPCADGTLVDGGVFGLFDGTADAADWYFNESTYEGAISLSRSGNLLEHRVVFEFNLGTVTYPTPVRAMFKFKLRGAARFPADPADVAVFSYPADVQETLTDFSAGPAQRLAVLSVSPFQALTSYTIDVSGPVNAAITGGTKKVGFRLQIDPLTSSLSSQAFMDILESDPTTKPSLRISDQVAGDFDGDRDVDLHDLAALPSCMRGPAITATSACQPLDADLDADVDLLDYARVLPTFTAPPV